MGKTMKVINDVINMLLKILKIVYFIIHIIF